MNLDDIESAWTGHRPFAQWLVQHLQPHTTVDLGVDYGYSTFALAEHNPGMVYGIDSFAGDAHAGERNTLQQVKQSIQDLKLTNVQLVQGLFSEVARNWTRPIDILHIDGLHTREAVTEDYMTWSAFVRPTGVILFHDTQAFPELGEFVRSLPGYIGEFEHSAGLGIVTHNQELAQAIKEKL